MLVHRLKRARSGALKSELLLVLFRPLLRTSKETLEKNCGMAQTGALSTMEVGLHAAALQLNGFTLVRRPSATSRSEQHIHAGCSTAPRLSQALETGGKEQLPIADDAPSQRRGEFKADQISLTIVNLLVSSSPIFQSLYPTNRLCSPPSGSCAVYLHIAPGQDPPSL